MTRTLALAALLAFAAASANAQTAPDAGKSGPSTGSKVLSAAKRIVNPEKPLTAADQAQLDAAERTYFGIYQCDFGQTIDVGMNPKYPGYVDVKFKKTTYTMKPSISSTGALRLEDVKGRGLLIQIANKSMLMDVGIGQRLVDDCVHEKQRAAHDAAAK